MTWIADVMHRVQWLSYSSSSRKTAGLQQLKRMQIVDFVHRTAADQSHAALNVLGCFYGNKRISAMQMRARAELGPEAYAFISSFQSQNVQLNVETSFNPKRPT